MPYLQRAFRYLPIVLGLAALALAILSQASVFHVQDDAYMYARYANNLRHGSGLAWDPRGEPTFGATALMYVPWVAVISSIFPGNPGLTVVLASVLSTLIALALIALLLARSLPSGEPGRSLVICICVTLIAIAHRKIASHATNGMDTGFAMACLALLLLAWWREMYSGPRAGEPRVESSRTSRSLIVCASWLAFAARPDLGLYALGIPLVLAVLAPRKEHWEFLKILAACLALVAASLALAWWYFGVPAPLSFYVKSFNSALGAPFLERHAPEARDNLILFLLDYAPLWMFAALDLPSRWRARAQAPNALWLAVLAPTLLHWMYYRFDVLQVVGFHQRFYYPTLPALFFIGATSMSRVLAIWNTRTSDSWFRKLALGACIAACGLLGARALVSAALMWKSETVNRQVARFDLKERYDIPRARANWFALDGFTRLPDELSIATSEVGLPAAMNPGKRVIDIVGLNETNFAMHGFDARRLCAELRPDVLYMPHPDYTAMTEQLLKDANFQADYVYYPAADLGAFMGLALRRASVHFAAMQEIVALRRAEGAAPGGSRK